MLRTMNLIGEIKSKTIKEKLKLEKNLLNLKTKKQFDEFFNFVNNLKDDHLKFTKVEKQTFELEYEKSSFQSLIRANYFFHSVNDSI